MKLNVPEVLKVLLVDDWEAVTKNNQVSLQSYLNITEVPHPQAVLSACPSPAISQRLRDLKGV